MKKQDKATEKEMKDLKAIEDAFKEFIPLGALSGMPKPNRRS